MPYNLTAISGNGTTGFVHFIRSVDAVLMFGWLGTLLLISLSLIVFLSYLFSTNDLRRSLVAGGFFSFMLSLLLFTLGMINLFAIYLTFIIFALAMALPRE